MNLFIDDIIKMVHSNAFILTALGALFILAGYSEIRHYQHKKEMRDKYNEQMEKRRRMPRATRRHF